jgi:DNA-binding FadR family transcriptional regulator
MRELNDFQAGALDRRHYIKLSTGLTSSFSLAPNVSVSLSLSEFYMLNKISKQMKRLARQRPGNQRKEEARLNKWLAADCKLHALLFTMAENKRARQIIENFNSQWHQMKWGMLALEGRIEKSAVEHERIVREVCAQRPAQAQKLMRTHLQNLKRELVKIMRLAHYPSN